MQIVTERASIPATGGRALRALVFRPAGARGPLPAVLAFSDIFQLTAPHARVCQRLAGYGYVVLAPEIFGRLDLGATALDFEADRQLALVAAERMPLSGFDEDRRAALDWMRASPAVDADRLHACGWCIGGHLALRAALEPDIRSTACFYPTGLHTDALGSARGAAGTLGAAGAIRGGLLLAWGTRDPHIPADGRAAVHRALADAGVAFQVRLYDAEHAFMRDEGPRHDPVATDRAFEAMLESFAASA